MRGGGESLSVRLAAHPASVPGARRFVVDGVVSAGIGHLADVAELIVSELAGNAALHGAAQFLYVKLTARPHGVRVAVEDDGGVPADAVEPNPIEDPDEVEGWDGHATTGRGLAIVSMLAAAWGVDVTPRGKRVWADVTDPDAVNEVRPPSRAAGEADLGAEAELPPGWVLVRFVDCPVELSIQQDRHLDDLVRELQLMATDDDPRSRAIAEEIEDVLMAPAHARLTGRRIADQAHAAGLDRVDIEIAMPPDFSVIVRQLDQAVARADELCEDNQLLAVASPPEVRELRAWMTHEIIAQLERGESPMTWDEWLERPAYDEQPAAERRTPLSR